MPVARPATACAPIAGTGTDPGAAAPHWVARGTVRKPLRRASVHNVTRMDLTTAEARPTKENDDEAKVVKTLNTVNANLMIDAGSLGGSDHDVFVSGNDAAAKARVTDLLRGWFGWKNVVDLGDITTARGVESYVALWVRLFGALQTPHFNIKIVR
jgi:predicted dinucleotide-binding enzyme